jgi:hypothetical protein
MIDMTIIDRRDSVIITMMMGDGIQVLLTSQTKDDVLPLRRRTVLREIRTTPTVEIPAK